MGLIVIVAYRPKPGREAELIALTERHVGELRRLGLATDRPAVAMRNRDGVVIELFEWRDGALERAHAHPKVLEMWEEYAAICDYVPLHELPEAREMFAGFAPLSWDPGSPITEAVLTRK